MPHNKRKKKNRIPKNYTPIEKNHCNINQVVDSIYYVIKTNWMTEEEFDEVYKQIKKKLKND